MAKLRMKKWVGWIIILAVILMIMGFPMTPQTKAALSGVKDTISDSDLGADANHTIQFFIGTALTASSTIKFLFDDPSDNFNLTGLANTDVEDYDLATTSDYTLVAKGGCTGAAQEIELSTSSASVDEIVFTLCWNTGTIPANTTTTIEIGTNADGGNTQINNPGTAGSYVVKIKTYNPSGTLLDSGEAVVAIIDDVVVTATVSATLTFTISGTATSTSVNGTVTNASTTVTTIPFGTLTVDATSTAAQNLTVATNASDGFTVTVFQNQNLKNAANDDIDCFKDGTCQASSTVWYAPTGTLGGGEGTYGHFGITSEDESLGTNCVSNSFGDNLWAGLSGITPMEVMCHTGPADGSTAHIGATRVGFQVEISVLQEAGDYTNTLTYIATPTY